MNKAIFKPLAASLLIALTGCSVESNQDYVAKRFKLAELPSTTKVEACSDRKEPDGIVFRECLITATPEDIQKLLSVYEFRQVNAPEGAVGYMASPGHMGMQGLRVFYNAATRKGTVDVYAP